ncbi:hypothetical protein, partial [Fluviicola sp.]|uniref:hypothetical protein n=1 Tax=Fluviicola sp. TaxID=1917219 RepID=UPI002633560E
IVKWTNGVISNIRVQQIKPSGNEGVYILSQDLDFDNRGILDSLYMFHGKRLVPVNYGSSVRYQTNHVYFDTLGNVRDFRFMKDFTYQFGSK